MLLVSVVNPKGINVSIGTEVKLFKDKNNQWDPNAIKVLLLTGEELGMVSARPETTAQGCSTSKTIYNDIEDGIKGIVVKIDTFVDRRGKTENRVIVQLEEDSKANGSVGANSKSDKDIDIILSVKGTKTKYPKKIDVLDAYNSSNSLPDVVLKVQDDNIIMYFEGEEAGIIDTKKYQDTNDFEEGFNVISSILNGEAEAQVVKVVGTNFRVKFSVSEKEVIKANEEKIRKTIGDLTKEVIDNGYVDEGTLNSIMEYLLKYNMSQEIITYVLGQYQNWTDEEKGMIFKFKSEDIPFVDSPDGLYNKLCLGVDLEGLHLQFVGNKGGGKNVLINTLSWILQRPLISFPANPNADKFDLLGAKGIESEVLENGNVKMTTNFQKEALVKAMEGGYILNMDEINMIDPGVLAILHGPADDRRNIDVPSYEHVEAKDKFILIATMNEEYEGTVRLNEALIDRMIQVEFERPKSIKEILKMKLKNKADIKDINVCDQIYKAIEEQIEDQKLDPSCSTIRGYIQALKISRFVGIKQALVNCVANKVREKDERKSLIALIDSFI